MRAMRTWGCSGACRSAGQLVLRRAGQSGLGRQQSQPADRGCTKALRGFRAVRDVQQAVDRLPGMDRRKYEQLELVGIPCNGLTWLGRNDSLARKHADTAEIGNSGEWCSSIDRSPSPQQDEIPCPDRARNGRQHVCPQGGSETPSSRLIREMNVSNIRARRSRGGAARALASYFVPVGIRAWVAGCLISSARHGSGGAAKAPR